MTLWNSKTDRVVNDQRFLQNTKNESVSRSCGRGNTSFSNKAGVFVISAIIEFHLHLEMQQEENSN